jgi:ribonuclease J
MASLTFHGGVNEIGGNKILLEDGGTRLWFDFGQSFTMGSGYFLNYLQPRRGNGLKDYFEFNLLPRVEGLYAEDSLSGTGLGYCEPGFQGVFVTHAHFDHVNHLYFVDPCIPVYTGKGTKLFMEAMEQTSPFTRYGDHPYVGFRTGDVVKVDGVDVEPIHVDHSIPAAYAYIIHLPDATVVYTGDMRAHGPRADMTQEFLEAAAYVEPNVMICEGTRMARRGRRRNLTEAQVEEGVKKVCRDADAGGKAVVYTHPGRDMDRLRTFHRAAESCGRVMVIHPKTAHLLNRLIEDEHLDLPDPMKDDLIRVYYKRKRSGSYDDSDYYVWERPYLDRIITAEEVHEGQKNFLVNLDFYSFTELIDIRPEKGSYFIYSMSEPFTEEDMEEEVLHNWLEHFGLSYHQLHASGHMGPKELAEAVNFVKPDVLMPVHCEEPQLFRKYYRSVKLPKLGEPIIF